MKKSTTIICSVASGAILGSAIICLLKSKKGRQMRKDAHNMILKEIEALKSKFGSMCNCSDGSCECSLDAAPEEKQLEAAN